MGMRFLRSGSRESSGPTGEILSLRSYADFGCVLAEWNAIPEGKEDLPVPQRVAVTRGARKRKHVSPSDVQDNGCGPQKEQKLDSVLIVTLPGKKVSRFFV